MRHSKHSRQYYALLNHIKQSSEFNQLITDAQNSINMEQLNLEAHETLGDELECIRCKRKITKAKLFLLLLSGDLP